MQSSPFFRCSIVATVAFLAAGALVVHAQNRFRNGKVEFKKGARAYTAPLLEDEGSSLDPFGKGKWTLGLVYRTDQYSTRRLNIRITLPGLTGPGKYTKEEISKPATFVVDAEGDAWSVNWEKDDCTFTFTKLDPSRVEGAVSCTGSEVPFGEMTFTAKPRRDGLLIVPEKRGFWRPVDVQLASDRYPLPAAEARVRSEQFRELAAVFAREKAVNPPMGFAVLPSARPGPLGWEETGRPGPMPGWLAMPLHGYYEDCNPTCTVGLGTAVEPLTTIWVSLNSISALDSYSKPKWEDEQGPMFFEPRLVGHVAGFPEYEITGFRNVIVLTKIKRSLWLPVSQERFIRNAIRPWKAELAKAKSAQEISPYQQWLKEKDERVKVAEEVYQRIRKRDPKAAETFRAQMAKDEEEVTAKLKAQEAGWASDSLKTVEFVRQELAALEAELASLSPAAKAAPAYVSPRARGSGLAKPGTEGAQPVVAPNRDFFDPSRPKTSIQLLVVDFGVKVEAQRDWVSTHPGEKNAAFTLRLLGEIRDVDWALLASFLDEDSRRR